MARRLAWLLKIGVLVYVGFGVVLYVAQRSMMYLPVPENPADNLAVEYVDVDGARLKVWIVNPGRPLAALYFGGNAEDVYFNAADFATHLPEHAVYLVNYRGYGGSSGTPTEAALFADALVLFDSLSARHEAVDTIGRSLGSGVAVYLASQRPVRRLALVTPFDSVLAMARRLYPVYPVDWMLKDPFDSVAYAGGITAPVCLLVAGRDTMVPPEHAERLAAAFTRAPSQSVLIEGAGHNDITAYPSYWRSLVRCLMPGTHTDLVK
jgi:pimeloyl-ACP methyl ester carboxylesterase